MTAYFYNYKKIYVVYELNGYKEFANMFSEFTQNSNIINNTLVDNFPSNIEQSIYENKDDDQIKIEDIPPPFLISEVVLFENFFDLMYNDNIQDPDESISLNHNDVIVCGPDVTSWFKLELYNWSKFAYDLNKRIKKLTWWMGLVTMKSVQYANLAGLASQLTYHPDTDFVSAGKKCPKGCTDTVTLCGGCIHRSELGNFVYGAIARYFQMTWMQTEMGAIVGNRGKRTDSDKASVKLGYNLIDSNKQADDLCTFLNNNAELWKDMKKDGKGCPECGSVVPRKTPGTKFPRLTDLSISASSIVTLPKKIIGNP